MYVDCMCCSTQACVACLSCLNVDLFTQRWVESTIRFQSLVQSSSSLMSEPLIMCSYRLLATLSHEPELINRVRVAVSSLMLLRIRSSRSRSDMIDRGWCSLEWGRVDQDQIWSTGLDAPLNEVEPTEVRYDRPSLMLPRMRSSGPRLDMTSRAWCSPE